MPRVVRFFVLVALGLSLATGCAPAPNPYSSADHMKAALSSSSHPLNDILKAGFVPNTVVKAKGHASLVFARIERDDNGVQIAPTTTIWVGLSTSVDDSNPQPDGTYRVRLMRANSGDNRAVEFAGPKGWKPTAANFAPGGFEGLATALMDADKIGYVKRGGTVIWGDVTMTMTGRYANATTTI